VAQISRGVGRKKKERGEGLLQEMLQKETEKMEELKKREARDQERRDRRLAKLHAEQDKLFGGFCKRPQTGSAASLGSMHTMSEATLRPSTAPAMGGGGAESTGELQLSSSGHRWSHKACLAQQAELLGEDSGSRMDAAQQSRPLVSPEEDLMSRTKLVTLKKQFYQARSTYNCRHLSWRGSKPRQKRKPSSF